MISKDGDTTSEDPDPEDLELRTRLGSLRADTAPPPELTAWASQAFRFRSLEAELAALVFDSDDPVGPAAERELVTVRRASSDGPGASGGAGGSTAPRRLMFESADERLALELTLTTSNGRRRLEGHLLPTGPVTVELRYGSAPAPIPVESDSLGGFVVEQLEPGTICVTCRRTDEKPVASEWFTVD